MSIANEISRLNTAKANIKTAIENKGVTVPSAATLDTYPTYINSISQSGGGASSSSPYGEMIDVYDNSTVNNWKPGALFTSVVIPKEVVSLDANAFQNSKQLETVTFESGSAFTSCGNNTFRTCTALQSVVFPSTLRTLGGYTFHGCTSLESVNLPEGMTTITASLFEGCQALSSITIPSTVTSIGNSAFSNCKALASIVIPSGVTTLNESVLYSCSGLTSVTLPNGLLTIGKQSLRACTGLTSLTIPSTVTTINDYAFHTCKNIVSLTCEATTPPTINGSNVFGAMTALTTVYVPSESVSAYQAASGWSALSSMIQAIPS